MVGVKNDKAAGWNSYWRGVNYGFSNSTPTHFSHPVIQEFWQDIFLKVKCNLEQCWMLDVACGDGAIVRLARNTFGKAKVNVACMDISIDAVQVLTGGSTDIAGLVADGGQLPFPGSRFNFVTSQYGIEYAGSEAFSEAARVCAEGGYLAFLIHHREGRFFKECTEDVKAIRELEATNFLHVAIDMFRSAMKGDENAFFKQEKAMAVAFSKLEVTMNRYGPHVAGGTLLQLCRNVAHAHDNIRQARLVPLLNWLVTVNRELPAYVARSNSMCDVAFDDKQFYRLCDQLTGDGFTVLQARSLVVSNEPLPRGWSLVAKKI